MVVTPEKLVTRLGASPTPVEVVPFALATVMSGIRDALPHVRITQRKTDLAPYITDNGNAVIDCSLGPITDPEISDIVLRAIHGVVATGLFPASLTHAVLVADENGVRELARPNNVFPLQRGWRGGGRGGRGGPPRGGRKVGGMGGPALAGGPPGNRHYY